MKVTINNTEVEIIDGETLIEAATRVGCIIPSLCYAKGAKHKSSCMVCAVKECNTGQIIPSCTTVPTEGMKIDTDSDEVKQIRATSLELLLSDHRADCEAPCKVACPASFDVAQMNRLYDKGEHEKALEHLRDSLVVPATLCYICNAPCEKICRRNDIDKSVAVREIKKELVLKFDSDKIRKISPTSKKIAIQGSDPAGLSVAYRLCKLGYDVTVFEKSEQILVSHIAAENVPANIIDLEIDVLRRVGMKFVCSCGHIPTNNFDAVVCTSGDIDSEQQFVLSTKSKQPARLVLEGRKLADKVHASLLNSNVDDDKPFNSSFTRFTEYEKAVVKQQVSENGSKSSCLYCDCNEKLNCKLRTYATQYGVKTATYSRTNAAIALSRQKINNNMWFESAKCIKCGLCVYNSTDGFTFKDRGFSMQVVLPNESAMNVNEKLAELCPTGALYIKS